MKIDTLRQVLLNLETLGITEVTGTLEYLFPTLESGKISLEQANKFDLLTTLVKSRESEVSSHRIRIDLEFFQEELDQAGIISHHYHGFHQQKILKFLATQFGPRLNHGQVVSIVDHHNGDVNLYWDAENDKFSNRNVLELVNHLPVTNFPIGLELPLYLDENTVFQETSNSRILVKTYLKIKIIKKLPTVLMQMIEEYMIVETRISTQFSLPQLQLLRKLYPHTWKITPVLLRSDERIYDLGFINYSLPDRDIKLQIFPSADGIPFAEVYVRGEYNHEITLAIQEKIYLIGEQGNYPSKELVDLLGLPTVIALVPVYRDNFVYYYNYITGRLKDFFPKCNSKLTSIPEVIDTPETGVPCDLTYSIDNNSWVAGRLSNPCRIIKGISPERIIRL